MGALVRVTAPAETVVSLAELRGHLRLVATGSPPTHPDDGELAIYLQAAIDQIDGRDGWLGRALVTQTWDYLLDAFPPADRGIRVPLPPLQSITSITYIDADEVPQVLATSGYRLDASSTPAFIAPSLTDGWPTTFDTINAVTVRFVAGYGDAADVPALIRNYVLVMAAQMYEHREAAVVGAPVAELPFVRHSLESFRVWSVYP